MSGSGSDRRQFLAHAGAASGALVLAFHLPGCAGRRARMDMVAEADDTGALTANAWITVTPDDRIIFRLDRVEMGQGTQTSHTMMVAEELEVLPETIEVVRADADRAFDNPDPLLGFQITGGSTSVRFSFRPLRKAAAAVRELLRQAAADTWGVALASVHAEGGAVHHGESGRSLRYGELTRTAALLPIPDPKLKPRSAWKVLGRSRDRLDAAAKVDGSGVFGLDVRREGQVFAVILRPIRLGATLAGFDAGRALARRGVIAVVEIAAGVAVVAESTWLAMRAAEDVVVDWRGGRTDLDEATMAAEEARRGQKAGTVLARRGRAPAQLAKPPAGARVIEGIYTAPFLAHATLEPQNATAEVREDGTVEVWAPTQAPGLAQSLVADALGVTPDDVTVHTTLIGGGFGRRLRQDYCVEAALVAQKIRRPVQVVWTREDDTRHDDYRPRSWHHLRGAVDKDGRVLAWWHRQVGPRIVVQIARNWVGAITPNGMPMVLKDGVGRAGAALYRRGIMPDDTATEGAKAPSYAVPHHHFEFHHWDPGVPIGWWRSVGHSFSAFVVESFIDELAHAAGTDPFEFRRLHLGQAERHRAVLELAATKAGWDTKAPAGVFRGIAQHFSFGSYAANVVEVRKDGDRLVLERVVSAIDCGQVLNPDGVAAQLESAVVQGLGTALFGRITFAKGAVVEGNFDEVRLLRLHECPRIESYVVPSDAEPTGVGEVGLPPVAPALGNAIFAATGQRLRQLPFAPALARLLAQGTAKAKVSAP
jgi:isoquinoline 1-oxidoreductase/isoquinoline 1-oxidoreductase beta subunit